MTSFVIPATEPGSRTDWTPCQARGDSIRRYFEQSTGLKFVWENEARELLQKPYGILKLGVSSVVDRDDIYDNTLVGSRELIVQAQVFSRTTHARTYLEKVRTLLRAFKDPTYVFVEAHPIVDLDFTFSNRQESRAAFDAVFRYLEQIDLSHLSPDYFTQVEFMHEP